MKHAHSDGALSVLAGDQATAVALVAALKAAGINSKAELLAAMNGIEDDLQNATTAAQALPPLRKLARLILFLLRHGMFTVE